MSSSFGSRTGAIVFKDRDDAGARLAQYLTTCEIEGPLLVLGLPRGGLPVAEHVAAALGAELDVLVVRKLGAPFNPELAIGAIAFGGIAIYNEALIERLSIDDATLQHIRDRESIELQRRENEYRGERPFPALEGRTVIIVDDGVATGATMYAAAKAARGMNPREVIVAVPTCSVDAQLWLREVADRVLALATPDPYIAVGAWFEHFGQVSDEEVIEVLARAVERDSKK